MDKQQLRREYRIRRDEFLESLKPFERSIAFSKAPSMLARYFSDGKIVAGYAAIGSEANPAALLKEAELAGCIIALPHITSGISPMRFLRCPTDTALIDGPFDLKQPPENAESITPDIVLVPLVAFDNKCNRLGQGAGHYDRALSLLPNAIKIGIAWSVQQAEVLNADPWDIPLDAIMTEKAWIEL
jgi:5-formyltetrahydrofolate cyclo-ligase